jgi:hypothetical protein
MQHSIRRCLALASTASLTLASTSFAVSPAGAEQPGAGKGTAADLGVMEVSLKDAVQFNWGFQGQTQGAGTPNEAGIGVFIPLAVTSNSVFYLDALANANFSDIANSTSIVGVEVSGTTISTSTRMGYRWLNSGRSWTFGVNAGYDSRPTTATDTATIGKTVISGSRTGYFQQLAVGLEAVSNSWSYNAYALIPIGTTDYTYLRNGGALDTYGLDAGYSITPDFKALVGYYYQQGDLGTVNGSGVRGRLTYDISNGLVLGANLSYDEAYATRFSADLKYRFGSNGYGAPSIRKRPPVVMPVIQALSTTPANRDVRVHDARLQCPIVGDYPECF